MVREDITSKGAHNKAAQKLHAFKERMMKHAEYYNSNQLITANFDFLKLVKVKELLDSKSKGFVFILDYSMRL